jgi:hypothetical protein
MIRYKVESFNKALGVVEVSYWLSSNLAAKNRVAIQLPIAAGEYPNLLLVKSIIEGQLGGKEYWDAISTITGTENASHIEGAIGVEYLMEPVVSPWNTPEAIALREAKAQAIADNLLSWSQVSDVVDAISNLAEAKVFIKKLARVVYWLAKNKGD